MSLNEEIRSKRPQLSTLSINAYASTLRSLYKKVFDDDKIKLSNFKKTKEILDYLKDVPSNKRKSILSALVVLTEKDEYREAMNKDINDYNQFISTQEKTDNQKENWVTEKTIRKKYQDLKKKATTLYNKNNPSMSDINQIQDYIIISLTSGIYIPPRRLLDWTTMKIKDINKEKHNFIDGNEFVFNTFKGSARKDTQRVDIPKELKTILNKWIESNPTEYLLFDVNGNKLSNVKLNQRLNKIFGKKISVNALRHTYLTNKYGDMIQKKKEIQETMEDMGSSSKMLETYVKKE